MNTFKWHSQLETGNELLDFEHKQVFQLIDSCIALSRSGATRENLIPRLNGIREYLAVHFKSEEIITACAGKPHSDIHKMQHNYLLDFMRSKIVDLADRENKKISAQEILVYLHDWYVIHIEGEDRRLICQ